jgi:hypothetical protein
MPLILRVITECQGAPYASYKFSSKASFMRRHLPLILMVVLTGCGFRSEANSMKLSDLDAASVRLARLAKKPVREYSTRDFGREKYVAARSVIVAADQAESILADLRAELGPGLIAFIGCTRSYAENPESGNEIVVANGADQFEILRVAASDAVNFDLTTEDIIEKLKEYDTLFGIDIFHAETDTIKFRLKKMPDDLKEFCKDLYKCCPDIVDQGHETMDNLEQSVRETQMVGLWWD